MCSCSFLRTNQSTCKQAGEVYYKMVRKNPQFILSSESDRYIIFWSVGKVKNCWRGWKSSVWDLDKSGNSRICTVFAGEAVRWNVLARGWMGEVRPTSLVLRRLPSSCTTIPSLKITQVSHLASYTVVVFFAQILAGVNISKTPVLCQPIFL